MSDDLTPDGYRIIPKRKPVTEPREKGIQCGECGAKFDTFKAYGFVCGNNNCPVFMKATFSVQP